MVLVSEQRGTIVVCLLCHVGLIFFGAETATESSVAGVAGVAVLLVGIIEDIFMIDAVGAQEATATFLVSVLGWVIDTVRAEVSGRCSLSTSSPPSCQAVVLTIDVPGWRSSLYLSTHESASLFIWVSH